MANTSSKGSRLNRALTAEILGVTPTTLLKWQNEGDAPPFDAADGTYSAEGLGRWIRTEMPFRKGRGGAYPYMPDRARLMKALGASVATPTLPGLESDDEPVMTTKAEEDTRLARLKADKQELDNAERAGTLVNADEVALAWIELIGRVKAKLGRIPSAAAPLVHGKADVHETQEVLGDFVREALEELSDTGRD